MDSEIYWNIEKCGNHQQTDHQADLEQLRAIKVVVSGCDYSSAKARRRSGHLKPCFVTMLLD